MILFTRTLIKIDNLIMASIPTPTRLEILAPEVDLLCFSAISGRNKDETKTSQKVPVMLTRNPSAEQDLADCQVGYGEGPAITYETLRADSWLVVGVSRDSPPYMMAVCGQAYCGGIVFARTVERSILPGKRSKKIGSVSCSKKAGPSLTCGNGSKW